MRDLDQAKVDALVYAFQQPCDDRDETLNAMAKYPTEACAALDKIVENAQVLRAEVLALHAKSQAEEKAK